MLTLWIFATLEAVGAARLLERLRDESQDSRTPRDLSRTRFAVRGADESGSSEAAPDDVARTKTPEGLLKVREETAPRGFLTNFQRSSTTSPRSYVQRSFTSPAGSYSTYAPWNLPST